MTSASFALCETGDAVYDEALAYINSFESFATPADD